MRLSCVCGFWKGGEIDCVGILFCFAFCLLVSLLGTFRILYFLLSVEASRCTILGLGLNEVPLSLATRPDCARGFRFKRFWARPPRTCLSETANAKFLTSSWSGLFIGRSVRFIVFFLFDGTAAVGGRGGGRQDGRFACAYRR